MDVGGNIATKRIYVVGPGDPNYTGSTSGTFYELMSDALGDGTASQLLTSQGSGCAPTWKNIDIVFEAIFGWGTANQVFAAGGDQVGPSWASLATLFVAVFGYGTSGQVLTSNGNGNLPTWQDLPA